MNIIVKCLLRHYFNIASHIGHINRHMATPYLFKQYHSNKSTVASLCTYILDDGDAEVLHVLDDTLLVHGDLSVLDQFSQILLTDTCEPSTSAAELPHITNLR